MHMASSVSSGKEMNNPINIRGVTDMARIQIQIEYVFYTLDLNGERLSIGKMIYDGVNRVEVNGPGK